MAPISLEKIEAIAPDQASLLAARKLVKPSGWSGLSCDDAGLIWGECQGSGSSPYRVVASEVDAGYKCTCPSRKFPCKHSLALMWMRSEGKIAFAAAQAPEWVQEWTRRRRPGAGTAGKDDSASALALKNLADAAAPVAEEVDPKAEARAAAARDRNRREREEAILGGLDDLDRWIADQIDNGLAAFAVNAGKLCRPIAQRLVDAKASGLASRVDGLPARLYALPEQARSTAALEQLGQLHLLAEAYRRQESLSSELRADVRREGGWTQSREALLTEEGTLTVSGTWRVLATLSEVQPDRLRRLESWLWRDDSAEGPRAAVLIDFVPVAGGPTRPAYQPGEKLGATLVFYPSARPLRTLVKEVTTTAEVTTSAEECMVDFRLPDKPLAAAMDEYEDALAAVPWLSTWPIAFGAAQLKRNGETLFLTSSDGVGPALPLAATQSCNAAPLLALESFDGFGLWNGHLFRPCFAQTALGRWVAE
ncbi:MAG TPA: SWIM zinc finger family protein [Terracidiphilus sp.]|nr:SWIM zinc finger family protein [Terracidiphilus sp.]